MLAEPAALRFVSHHLRVHARDRVSAVSEARNGDMMRRTHRWGLESMKRPVRSGTLSCVPAALVFGALGLAALLSACNGVVSGKPWLARTDAAGALRLREGIWRGVPVIGPPCPVDERQPIDAWPDCASPIVVRRSELVELSKDKGRWRRTTVRYVLATGQPIMLQIGASQSGKSEYEYQWVRVTGLDDQGRLIAVAGWRVLCGPSGAGSQSPLYPGLTAQDADCTANSIGALWGAAKASEASATTLAQVHWVRDGSR
jgi:hypothetical protein